MKTTTINNVQVTEEQLRNALAEIEAQPKPFPQERDTFFRTVADGSVVSSQWCGTMWEQGCLAIGNIYRTKEEAECVVAQRKAETKVCRRLRELEGDFKFSFHSKESYLPVINVDMVLTSSWYCSILCPMHWYSTRAAWEQVISEMEDDVKVMMGVLG